MRLFRLAALCVLMCLPSWAALTRIQDTLYKADGSTHNGTIYITWSSFVAADGSLIHAGTLATSVRNGVLDVYLQPLDTASPAGMTYRVEYRMQGQDAKVEYWSVTTSVTSLTVGDVRIIGSPSPPYYVPWTIALGGTGASTASGARTSLGAAASGANSDITSLTATESVNGATLMLKTGDIDRIEIAADGTVTNKTYSGLWNLGTSSKLRVAKIQFWDALVNAKGLFFHMDWDPVDGRYEFQGSPSVAQYGGGWRYDATNGTLQALLSFNSGVQDAAATVLPRFSITKDGHIIFTTTGIPVYANNAAAVAGGLAPGTLYRTGGDPDVLAIVH